MISKNWSIFWLIICLLGFGIYDNVYADYSMNNYTKLFSQILKNEKNYKKDSYILFDCLYDKGAESIDAYSLFSYMKEHNEKVYYVLLKDSCIYNKLKEKNELDDSIIVIDKYSKNDGRDFIEGLAPILPKTKAIITSFGTESIIDKYFNNIPYLKYIFIQHGQIYFKESVMNNFYMHPLKFPYVLSSSEIESYIFKKYGWKNENILKAGLPRWDLLKNNLSDEKSIFVMFTWRKTTPQRFAKSLYLKRLNSLLRNEDLQNFLKNNGVKIYFAFHHAFKENSNVDFSIDNPNIEIADTQKISSYIKKSSMLLTDLSSVAFDFMFQNKPVVLYGLDRGDKVLEKNQYQDLELLKQRQDVFPNIFFDEKEVIEKIKYYVKNDFKIEDEVKGVYDKFFYEKENVRKRLVSEIKRICD